MSSVLMGFMATGDRHLESDPMPTEPRPQVTELPGRVLRQRLAAGESLTLLDVREPEETAYCKIDVPPTAQLLIIPMREVPGHLDEINEALGRGPLVVYCHHGVRSLAVAEWLCERQTGEISNLSGGIDAWSVEVDPRVPRYR
jgi:rhodanese-related sulfurtransferase